MEGAQGCPFPACPDLSLSPASVPKGDWPGALHLPGQGQCSLCGGLNQNQAKELSPEAGTGQSPRDPPGSPACQAPVVIPSVLGGNPRMQRREQKAAHTIAGETEEGGLCRAAGGRKVAGCLCAAQLLSCPPLCIPVAGHLYPHKLPSLAVIMLRKWPDAVAS